MLSAPHNILREQDNEVLKRRTYKFSYFDMVDLEITEFLARICLHCGFLLQLDSTTDAVSHR
jgi:hypothetical protein